MDSYNTVAFAAEQPQLPTTYESGGDNGSQSGCTIA